MPRRLLHVWAGFRSQQGFPGRDRVLLVMCHDMALRLVAVARSRHSFFMLRHFYVATELAKVKRFYVAIKNSISRQSCHLSLAYSFKQRCGPCSGLASTHS